MVVPCAAAASVRPNANAKPTRLETVDPWRASAQKTRDGERETGGRAMEDPGHRRHARRIDDIGWMAGLLQKGSSTPMYVLPWAVGGEADSSTSVSACDH